MNLSSVRAGDMVEVNKKGRRFHAFVRARGDELTIRPLERNISYRTAVAREVVGVWHANKATRARVSDA